LHHFIECKQIGSTKAFLSLLLMSRRYAFGIYNVAVPKQYCISITIKL